MRSKRKNQFLMELGNLVGLKVPNRRYEDYELYVTVAEEEEFLIATNEEEFDEQGGNNTDISDKTLSKVAHYIMVHYAEKELIKKRKKKYKPKDGQYTMDAGLKKFGDKGERCHKGAPTIQHV